ncbi:MAG: molecular chaperone DnaJ [Myxococcota bacterium]|nr:molecular chaperone DnaJ [Myxococcota bacterium]
MVEAAHSLARTEALVRTSGPALDPVREAEQRLRAALEEVTALDTELEALSETLARFGLAHDSALEDAYRSLEEAERVPRRVQRLQEELRRLVEALRNPPPAPVRRVRRKKVTSARRTRSAVDEEVVGQEEETADTDQVIADSREDQAKLLKRLLRRLARVLHPDLGRDEDERCRLHQLMSQVNAAYERGDRTELELIAEKVGAGEALENLTAEEKLAHLDRRQRALAEAARTLRRQLETMRGTASHRLFQEHEKRRAQGREFFAETRGELVEEEAAALADGWHRLTSLHRAASALSAEWGQTMNKLSETRDKKGRALRAFDPVLESPLVRRGLERLEERRASVEARTLARELEERSVDAPWQVALTLFAYFAERALRPPDGLKSQQAWKDRYQTLRARFPDAPDYEHALSRLPAHLELGMRTQGGQVHAGVQLRDASLAAGVSIALEGSSVGELAREVFLQLGAVEQCKSCQEQVGLLHLLRTRGLDELNAMVCPRCAKVQKRYWLYSRNDGIEALLPDAQKLGLVVEQVVRFGGASLGFQMLPSEKQQLTVRELIDRLWECYLTPYQVEIPPGTLELFVGARRLRADARISQRVVGAKLSPKAGLSSTAAVELLRSRIERRFRP